MLNCSRDEKEEAGLLTSVVTPDLTYRMYAVRLGREKAETEKMRR